MRGRAVPCYPARQAAPLLLGSLAIVQIYKLCVTFLPVCSSSLDPDAKNPSFHTWTEKASEAVSPGTPRGLLFPTPASSTGRRVSSPTAVIAMCLVRPETRPESPALPLAGKFAVSSTFARMAAKADETAGVHFAALTSRPCGGAWSVSPRESDGC